MKMSPIGHFFEETILLLKDNLLFLFNGLSNCLLGVVTVFEALLFLLPWYGVIALAGIALYRWVGRKAFFICVVGLWVIQYMMLWEPTMRTLALVLTSSLLAFGIGMPIGILAARWPKLERVVKPVLDIMQTMPPFVYLIPSVLFFGLGKVPGVIATTLFAMPPAIRLTCLGIKQVPKELTEVSAAFGATGLQCLCKVKLPVALPSLLIAVNQTIMMALSMVVVGGMIGAGGLGHEVLKGIQQLHIGLGFEAGVAVVILAIVLDRISQGISQKFSARGRL